MDPIARPIHRFHQEDAPRHAAVYMWWIYFYSMGTVGQRSSNLGSVIQRSISSFNGMRCS